MAESLIQKLENANLNDRESFKGQMKAQPVDMRPKTEVSD